jgi:hypothetical protein
MQVIPSKGGLCKLVTNRTKGDDPMAFEEYKAEISLLLSQISGDPGNAHEIQMRLHTLFGTMRAEGLPVPEDLKTLEADLEESFGPAAPKT